MLIWPAGLCSSSVAMFTDQCLHEGRCSQVVTVDSCSVERYMSVDRIRVSDVIQPALSVRNDGASGRHERDGQRIGRVD